MGRARTIILRVRDSFWFWPAVLGVLAAVAAQVLVDVDRSLLDAGRSIPFLDALSASGGRSVLTTVGTSMLTVAGTSFSIVISVLATTTSTYGPRLVRNFMADRANQLVLAAFTSTFVYCLVALRTVHTEVDDTDAFVPVIAVHTAVLLGMLDAAVLVFFIHHVATSVQITTLQSRVRNDLDAAIASAYPEHPGDEVSTSADDAAAAAAAAASRRTTIEAARDGYVEDIAWRALRDDAVSHDLVVRVVAMPGTHVLPGEALLEVACRTGDGPPDDAVTRLRTRCTLGGQRTPYQDVRFALQQLVESAVRGLASGSNDPWTAVSALDLAAAALAPVLSRPPVTAWLDDDGSARVLCDWPDPASLVDEVVRDVCEYAAGQPVVLDAVDRFVDRLAARADRPADAAGWRARVRDARATA